MKSPAKLSIVPADERVSARDAARAVLKEALDKLKQGSKEVLTSRRLLSALEAACADSQDVVVRQAAVAVVTERLEQMKKSGSELDVAQRRDLKIILFFGTSQSLADGLRQDACALLKLRGDERSIAEVCRVYPGLRKMFDGE